MRSPPTNGLDRSKRSLPLEGPAGRWRSAGPLPAPVRPGRCGCVCGVDAFAVWRASDLEDPHLLLQFPALCITSQPHDLIAGDARGFGLLAQRAILGLF